MKSNPYITPQTSSELDGAESLQGEETNRDIGTALAWFVLIPCVGGAIGFAGYLVAAMGLESSVIPNVEPPKYTYGQQSGLVSLPLSTVIGFAAGVAFAGFATGWRRLGSLAMIGVAILGALVTYRMWYADGIGECNSAIVLYYPIFGLCAIFATTGIVLAVIGFLVKPKPIVG